MFCKERVRLAGVQGTLAAGNGFIEIWIMLW